jgi:hypothetical protein
MLLRSIFLPILLLISTRGHSQIYLNGDTINDQSCRRVGLIQLDWTETIDTSSSYVILYYTVHIDKIIDEKEQEELDKFLDKNLVGDRGDTLVYYFYYYRYDLETLSSLLSHFSLKTSLDLRKMMFVKMGAWGLGAGVAFINPVAGLLVISAGEIWSLNYLKKISRDSIEMSVDVQGK